MILKTMYDTFDIVTYSAVLSSAAFQHVYHSNLERASRDDRISFWPSWRYIILFVRLWTPTATRRLLQSSTSPANYSLTTSNAGPQGFPSRRPAAIRRHAPPLNDKLVDT